jgi:four helix bundle protein
MKSKKIETHCDLEVYKKAFEASMELFILSKTFPKAEMYALTDQLRRCSRSVCANLAEAWRKRRYRAAFIAKLNDVEAEAAETQVWIQYSVRCQYLVRNQAVSLYQLYDEILRMLVTMINHPESWIIR